MSYAKSNEKKLREIAKWEKEKLRPKNKLYMIYLILIITLVYITDEVASQISMQMKTEIANDLFIKFGDRSVGIFDALSLIAVPFMLIAIFYKPLADKFGRKKFLVINTFGMGTALFFIFLSQNYIMYIVGYCVIQFFTPHDMQVVYIMETAPPKKRALIYSAVKGVSTLGVMLIPLMRRVLMHNASQWRMVFLVPAIVGLVTSFLCLFFAKETDAFIESRLRYLKMSDEELKREQEQKSLENAQGGVIPALKYAFKHKQLRWLYIAVMLLHTGNVIPMQYQVIMSYGFAENSVKNGMFSDMASALDFASTGAVTLALFMFPIGSAIVQFIPGFIADLKSRKLSTVIFSVVCVASFVGFTLGSKLAWSPYIVGLLCGMCVGSYYAVGDLMILMTGESSPTNLRSSIMAAENLPIGLGCGISYLIVPLLMYFGNSVVSILTLAIALPGLVLGILSIVFKTKDTTGLNLENISIE